jgi:hypothetical protein
MLIPIVKLFDTMRSIETGSCKTMIIIPEIQIQDGKVITRAAIEGDDIIHDITPRQAVSQFVADGAQVLALCWVRLQLLIRRW